MIDHFISGNVCIGAETAEAAEAAEISPCETFMARTGKYRISL